MNKPNQEEKISLSQKSIRRILNFQGFYKNFVTAEDIERKRQKLFGKRK